MLIFKNDFHNTEVIINSRSFHKVSENVYDISASVYKRIQKSLCGIESCLCYSPYAEVDGNKAQIETYPDGSARIYADIQD